MTDDALRDALRRHFGFSAFRLGQLDTIRQIMAGRDALVVMPTGAGKSLCFQLPALLSEGTTLVISPLIALMKDQVEALQAAGVAATFINSSLDSAKQEARLHALARGHWKLCYVAPERLRNPEFRAALANTTISRLAIDEAHCISQWGHDFRPEYRAIGEYLDMLGRPPVVALTATATPQVQQDIERQLRLEHPFRQVTGFNRPNLHLHVCFAPGDTRKQQELKRFLEEQPVESCGVVYVGRRREAEEVADFLCDGCGRPARFYHGGMSNAERNVTQEAWMSNRTPVIVATNAFGMGVDKPDVRFVVHYTLPGTLEAYYQEAGRAGRDGEPSQCLVLFDPADARLHEWFIENDTPSMEELRTLYREVQVQARRNGGYLLLPPSQLATILDWRSDSKVRVGLKLFEQTGLLQDVGDVAGTGNAWRYLPPPSRVDMQGALRELELRESTRRQLLRTMLEYAQTHECRRQFLLDYFGDADPPVAEWCCDNCQHHAEPTSLQVARSPEEKIPLLVLDAVAALPYGVGRVLLAKILTGSRASGLSRYYEHPQYGILSHMRQGDVERLIEELLRERYLQIEAGRYQTVALSAAGKQVVARRLAIPLAAIPMTLGAVVKHVPLERVTDTVSETHRLLEEGLAPADIAAERGLTVGTIFNHLAALIEQGAITVDRVVADEARHLIEEAVEEVGSFYLSPIKARLPEEISYGEIRCVVAAMRDPAASPAPPPPVEERARNERLRERLLAWRGDEARRTNQPAYFIFANTVIDAIAEACPTSRVELEAITGVTLAKSERYASAILALVSGNGAEG